MTADDKDLAWLMNDLIDRVPGAEHSVLLTTDGLLMAHTEDLVREDAEHISAVGSAYRSLSSGTAQRFSGGAVQQTVVEMAHKFLLVVEAGHGACLALMTSSEADLDVVAYEMAATVSKVGPHLTAEPRE